jgi:flagellin
MTTVINTNMASLFAQNSLANAQNNLATSVQRLSSGLRINSAKDDAAGLAISQSMQGQINGTNQSIRNLSDATNLLQTADTSLATIQDMLLRLKQLAVQGYDGSLSATQKLSIVNEMKDLNTEINTTSTRTQFNGINLLSNGAYVDTVNSDFYAGSQINSTAFSFSSAGLTASGTLSTVTTASYTVDIADAYKNKLAGQTFTLSSSGSNLTITGTLDGQSVSQTVSIDNVVGDGSAVDYSQPLDFSTFGVKINLTTTSGSNYSTTLGSAIASDFVTQGSLIFQGLTAKISDVRLSGAESGTFVLTASGGTLTMAGTINGTSISQDVVLESTYAKNTTSTIDFSSFGVKLDVQTFANDMTGTQLAAQIDAANDGTQTEAGSSLVINNAGNSTLKFQSGPTEAAYVSIETLNTMTGSTGSYAGSTTQMKGVGSAITGTDSGYLGNLSSTDSITTWQTAFKNAQTAIDTALDYISTQRGVYGSQMNRLSYVSTNLSSQSTNLQNSRSAIIDTDFASETAKLTKGQIMQQAATAMLAQANQMPNVVLSLLK